VVGKLKPKANLHELKTRTKSWWIMAALFVGTNNVQSHHFVFRDRHVVFYSLQRTLFHFLLSVTQIERAVFWAFVAIPIQYYLAYIGWYGAYIIFIPIVMFLFLPMRLVLKGDTAGYYPFNVVLHWVLMLTVFGLKSHCLSPIAS
jgi:phosphatidate cytidylyltransferase